MTISEKVEKYTSFPKQLPKIVFGCSLQQPLLSFGTSFPYKKCGLFEMKLLIWKSKNEMENLIFHIQLIPISEEFGRIRTSQYRS